MLEQLCLRNFQDCTKIMRKLLKTTLAILVISGITLPCFSHLSAQYFGRNKVQYENFQFNVLRTDHYDIYHYPDEHRRVKDASVMLERWYNRYTGLLDYSIKPYQPVILYANHADFQQTNVIGGIIPQSTGGVTEGMQNRMVIPLTGINRDDNHVLGHELVHAFQYDLLKSSGKRLSAARRMPTWFVEGMAEYLSVGRRDALTAMWMRDAVLHHDVPTIKKITRSRKYFPYRYGHALWAFIAGNYGDKIMKPLLLSVLDRGWNASSKEVLGLSSDSLSTRWQHTIRHRYEPQISGRTPPDSVGEPLIHGEGGMNLAPTISPDGKYVAYLSRRDLFSMNLYLADAGTGEIVKKLTSSTRNAHFDALRFMNSAGAWSPDGAEFAFVVFEDGDNEIALMNVNKRKVRRTIKLHDIPAVTDIAWSPGGDLLAVAGNDGGISNLYLYDLRTDELDQLTGDVYSDYQPAWSPDGNTLAFVTDRGTETDTTQQHYRTAQIGLMNIQTGDIDLLSMGPHVKHINPQFSPDGRSLFMVSDPDGVSNLYRFDFREETFYRITDIATGISGLTELSPTMSVSENTGRVLMTVFDKMEYNINAVPEEETEGQKYVPQSSEYFATVSLPPDADYSRVQEMVSNSEMGLPGELDVTSREYQPSLNLLNIGRSTIGLSMNRYGSALAGGVNMLFGDMLGDHMLSVTARVNGGPKTWGGQVVYQNRATRYNWGVAGAHTPYLDARTFSSIVDTTIDGRPVQAREVVQLRRWVFNQRLNIIGEYPFSRNRRLEFTAGYTRIGYDTEAEQLLTIGGQIIDREQTDLPEPDAVNLYHGSIAYVGDYSFFGFTAPVNGRRFRFELEPTFGTHRFVGALADYRHYFFWNPLTFAVRALHYGRYLQDSESRDLTPLYLGYRTWVRGYEQGSFDLSECTGRDGECPEFARLNGTRIGIFNAELRLPLFGTEQYGILDIGFLPVDLIAFFDGGVAWTGEEQPVLKYARESTERIPVFSTGAGARINLFGYLVGQVYYAYPFQRPDTGGHFGFVISQGW